MEMQAIINPEIEKSTQRALSIIDVLPKEIITVEDYMNAQSLMKMVKERIKELTDTRMSQTRLLDDAKSKIIAFFSPPLEKLEKAKAYLNKIMVGWTEEQERIRREEEKKLQEAARKRAEEDALQQALEAEAAGDKQEAEAIIQEPVYVPPIKVVSEIPKSKESHIVETWNAIIDDPMALVKAVAEGKADIQAIEPNKLVENHPFLNILAKKYKLKLNIPGVRAVSKKTQT